MMILNAKEITLLRLCFDARISQINSTAKRANWLLAERAAAIADVKELARKMGLEI